MDTLTAILRYYVYIENNMVMDYVRELILRMAVGVSKIEKFGFALKNWPKNMYHICKY